MNLKSIHAHTDKGPFLQVNEDGYELDFSNELFMLFDAFGGAGRGDSLVEKLKSSLKELYTKISYDENATLPFFFSPKYLVEGNAAINSMLHCHDVTYKDNLTKSLSGRSGCSTMMMAKSESILTLVSTGNCSAYIYRRGKLKKIFVEDSYVFLSNDDYNSHLKTMPQSAIGLFPDLYYQTKEIRVQAGDMIIALTDGVYANILPEEISDIISRNNSNSKLKIQELFDLANHRGNLDNQTAMILEF